MTEPEPYDAVVIGSGEGGKYLAWQTSSFKILGTEFQQRARGQLRRSQPGPPCRLNLPVPIYSFAPAARGGWLRQ